MDRLVGVSEGNSHANSVVARLRLHTLHCLVGTLAAAGEARALTVPALATRKSQDRPRSLNLQFVPASMGARGLLAAEKPCPPGPAAAAAPGD